MSSGEDPNPACIVRCPSDGIEPRKPPSIRTIFADEFAFGLDRTRADARRNATTLPRLGPPTTLLSPADLNELGICGGPSYACVIDTDYGTLLGWGYVLEGSRLGARFIRSMVEATGDPQLLNATRFLRHGENEDFWKTSTQALAQIDQDEAAIARAGIAAQIAFGCFLHATAQ
jgi:hypothetical protein